jgi:hypothetical protein
MRAKSRSQRKPRHVYEHPAFQAVIDDLLSEMEANYRLERDPIYVWRAISFCDFPGRDIPHWCLEYLFVCAAAIGNLVKDLEEPPGSNSERPMPPAKAAMSPAKKAAEAFRVFGFVRPGWNAFERFASRQQNASIAGALREAREQTKLSEQADAQAGRRSIKNSLAKQAVDDLVRSTGMSRTRLYDRAAKEKKSPRRASRIVRIHWPG